LALESVPMIDFADWFPLATVGLTFTLLGSLKLCGLNRGIVGGAGKPVVQRICAHDPPGRAAVCGWGSRFYFWASVSSKLAGWDGRFCLLRQVTDYRVESFLFITVLEAV